MMVVVGVVNINRAWPPESLLSEEMASKQWPASAECGQARRRQGASG